MQEGTFSTMRIRGLPEGFLSYLCCLSQAFAVALALAVARALALALALSHSKESYKRQAQKSIIKKSCKEGLEFFMKKTEQGKNLRKCRDYEKNLAGECGLPRS